MHFHLPKPLHGWREFLGEVGIIVVGVLIALAAEQLVQNFHWRALVRETDQRVQQDVLADLTNAEERFAIDPCLRPRLAELRDSLLIDRANWPGSRAKFVIDIYKSGFPSVYRTPARPWTETSWHTALNGETLSICSLIECTSSREFSKMSTVYATGRPKKLGHPKSWAIWHLPDR